MDHRGIDNVKIKRALTIIYEYIYLKSDKKNIECKIFPEYV